MVSKALRFTASATARCFVRGHHDGNGHEVSIAGGATYLLHEHQHQPLVGVTVREEHFCIWQTVGPEIKFIPWLLGAPVDVLPQWYEPRRITRAMAEW